MRTGLLVGAILAVSTGAMADLWVEGHTTPVETRENIVVYRGTGSYETVTVDIFQIHLVADTMTDAASVWHVSGHAGFQTASGNDGLIQCWGFGVQTNPEMMNVEDQIAGAALTQYNSEMDTHLLGSSRKPNPNDPGDIGFFGGTLQENCTSAIMEYISAGSNLGNCDVAIYNQVLDLPFVQLGIIRGEFVEMKGWVQKGSQTETIKVDLLVGVPEPVSLALLAVGAAGVLLRRRR